MKSTPPPASTRTCKPTGRWADWTLQAGLRHNTMKMDVDDRFVSGTDGDDSGSKTYQKNTPSVSVMYAFTPDLHGYVERGQRI